MGAIKHQNRLGGDTVRALERNLLNSKHYGPPTLLGSLLVKSSMTHPIPIKPALQGSESVPGGSVVNATIRLIVKEGKKILR